MASILDVYKYNQHFVAMMNVINAARLNPPESGLKKSNSLKGRVFTEEHRKKLSEAAKRRVARNGGYAIVR